MKSRAARLLAGLIWLVFVGCSGPGPLRSAWISRNALRSNVARLETENERLERELADAKANNRRFQDQLVDAEEVNGELRARLDDARYALKGQGLDPNSSVSRQTNSPRSSKTLPAGRPKVPGRKAPFATIPGRIEAAEPPTDEADSTDPDRTSYRWRPASPGGIRLR